MNAKGISKGSLEFLSDFENDLRKLSEELTTWSGRNLPVQKIVLDPVVFNTVRVCVDLRRRQWDSFNLERDLKDRSLCLETYNGELMELTMGILPEVSSMSAKEVWQKAVSQKHCLEHGEEGYKFVLMSWKSQDSGKESGPYLITVEGNTAIEIDRHGRFVKTFLATAEGYFPWMD